MCKNESSGTFRNYLKSFIGDVKKHSLQKIAFFLHTTIDQYPFLE